MSTPLQQPGVLGSNLQNSSTGGGLQSAQQEASTLQSTQQSLQVVGNSVPAAQPGAGDWWIVLLIFIGLLAILWLWLPELKKAR